MTNNEEEEDQKSPSDKYKGEALNAYRAFDEVLKVRKGDHFAVKVLKVTGRVLGITLFILLSPLVMIGLFLAFIAAS
ncbi:MAG: hypothetical protein KDC85_22645 [Saprospiraceae bacterium]|nr:hypothetical protein [Saprospiraceae bacterium]MCB9323592.1 hypothetical protein [Lewinellaceae bacterium]